MHTISINLYTFGELAPEVQKKVVERERYLNVDDSFWYESIIEDWTEQLERRGFEPRTHAVSHDYLFAEVGFSYSSWQSPLTRPRISRLKRW